MSLQLQAIREAFSALRRDARAHHRDIAERLGVSEGELIAAHVCAAEEPWAVLRVTRLHPQWSALMAALAPLGEVTALTCNASCVHEKVEPYGQAGHPGQALWGEAGLLAPGANWAQGFAVTELTDKGELRSLQFFDAAGTAVHKILLGPAGDLAAYEALVGRFADADQRPGMDVRAVALATGAGRSQVDARLDARGLPEAWRSLRDTRAHADLLRRFGITRLQALRLVEGEFAQPVDVTSAHRILDVAAVNRVAIMVLTGNAGMVQVHAGIIDKVSVTGPWVQIQDAGFRLRLREDRIASAWVVRRPAAQGVVTSLELFDQAGEVIALFYGELQSDRPERCEWRTLMAGLLKESAACAA